MHISPMMQQYMDIKDKHLDCILFFRLGDFYEMFFDDAILVSRELELVLTGKQYGQKERAPMCGVPFHSAESYIAKLINKGYKVAICEQVEDPATAKGIVKREVIRIVTPGTVISQSMLDEKENNYLVSELKKNFIINSENNVELIKSIEETFEQIDLKEFYITDRGLKIINSITPEKIKTLNPLIFAGYFKFAIENFIKSGENFYAPFDLNIYKNFDVDNIFPNSI